MPTEKQELVVKSIVAEIAESENTGKQFLIYTLPTAEFDRPVAERLIATLRELGYHVTYFSMPDRESHMALELYICWTEAARQDGIRRGYQFGPL